jgi:hypothetical protein
MLQASFSVILHSLMGGIVFAKLSKPKNRTETLIFSRSAVIAPRDGQYSLMCRVGDMRRYISYFLQLKCVIFTVFNIIKESYYRSLC